MKKPIKLRTFKHGDPPKPEEGLRIGTTRRPPRGVSRERWKSDNHFDVWFPILGPSQKLLSRYQKDGKLTYQDFCALYEHELLGKAESRQAIELLAELSLRIPISIGCYCKDESICHRKHLRKLIETAARKLKK